MEVSELIFHPKFNKTIGPKPYDIAILRLAAPIKAAHFFLCLPPNDLDQFIGIKGTVSGWGYTSGDKVLSKVKTD